MLENSLTCIGPGVSWIGCPIFLAAKIHTMLCYSICDAMKLGLVRDGYIGVFSVVISKGEKELAIVQRG